MFGGTISEKFGPRKALFVITVIWGVATLWTGFAVGFWTLFAARALLGLSEAAAFPTATQAMSRWIPRDRNGFAQGVVHSAARLGNALAPLIVAWVHQARRAAGGWAFFATAVLSFAWAVVWFVWFRDKPESAKGITQVELDELPPVETRATRPPVPWRQMAKQILPVTFVDFGYGWTLWVFLTWLPTFLSSTYGLEIGDFALFTTLILLAGVVGDTVGGMLSDRIIHRGGNTRNARRTILVIGLGGSLLCLIPLVIGQGLLVATISLALSFFFLELCNANLWAIPMDVAPQWSGTASGFMNTGFGIAGVVSPDRLRPAHRRLGLAAALRAVLRPARSRGRRRVVHEAAAADLHRRRPRDRHPEGRAAPGLTGDARNGRRPWWSARDGREARGGPATCLQAARPASTAPHGWCEAALSARRAARRRPSRRRGHRRAPPVPATAGAPSRLRNDAPALLATPARTTTADRSAAR